MVKYICPTCERIFDRKTSLEKHLARKTKCTKNGSKTSKKSNPKCNGCKKSFSRNDSLARHMKTCKELNKNKIKGNKNVAIAGNENATANGNENAAIAGDNNDTHINSPIYNINMVFFGKDGIDSLDFKDFVNIIKSDRNPYEALISAINFNPNKPQHHNVYLPDMKSTCGKVYHDKKWIDKKTDEIVNIMLDAKTEDFYLILEKMGDDIGKKTKQRIIDTINDVSYSRPNARKKLISYLKPILFTNRNMVIKTKKLIEEYSGPSDDDIDENDDSDEYADPEVFRAGVKMSDIKKKGFFSDHRKCTIKKPKEKID